MFRATRLPLAGLLLLAGCGEAADNVVAPAPVDPAVTAALADPIMTDPDLTSQNDSNAAMIASGPADAALPPIDRSDEAIAAALEAAARLTGGTPPPPPEPSAADLKPFREAMTAAQMALAAKVRGDCTGQVRYTAQWAASLPGPLQVYPRGAVEEAAGTTANGCALRIVHFKTPAGIGDLAAFYHARLRTAGFSVHHGADGEERVLRGRKGASIYAIYVRKAEDGLTAADIVVAG